MRKLLALFHVHFWASNPNVGSKGFDHFKCRCGKTKRVLK